MIFLVIGIAEFTGKPSRSGISTASSSSNSSIPFPEFDARFGAGLFSLVNPDQLNRTSNQIEVARSDVQGLTVRWSGVVLDVVDDQVLIRHRLMNSSNEVALVTNDPQRNSLRRGDLVEYTGTISSFGEPYPFGLTDGRIISSRSISLEEQIEIWGKNDEAAIRFAASNKK